MALGSTSNDNVESAPTTSWKDAKSASMPDLGLCEVSTLDAGGKASRRPRRSSKLKNNKAEDAKISFAPSNIVPLENRWTFWYDERPPKGLKEVDYNSLIKEVGSFSTVQEFWRYWNAFVDPSKFPDGSNLRLFKCGIKPLWEDSANVDGGKWVVTVDKQETAKLWIHLVLSLIGEQLEFSDDICGAVLAVRNQGDSLHLWNRTSRDQVVIEATAEHLRKILSLKGEKNIPYKSHVGSIEYNRQFTPTLYTAKGHLRRSSVSSSPNGSRKNSNGSRGHRRLQSYNGSPHEGSHRKRSVSATNHISSDNGAGKGRSSNSGGVRRIKSANSSAQSSENNSPTNSDCDEYTNNYVNELEMEEPSSKNQSPGRHRKSSSFSVSPFDSSPQWQQHRKSHSDSKNKKSLRSTLPLEDENEEYTGKGWPSVSRKKSPGLAASGSGSTSVANSGTFTVENGGSESKLDFQKHKRWPSVEVRAVNYVFNAPPEPPIASPRRSVRSYEDLEEEDKVTGGLFGVSRPVACFIIFFCVSFCLYIVLKGLEPMMIENY